MRTIDGTGEPTAAPAARAALAFLALILLQGVHELEHVVQVTQRFVLGNPTGAGILGSWLDIEPVHMAYNTGFLALIVLCYLMGGFPGEVRRRHPVTFWLMTFVLLFEGYHVLEHVVKMAQFLETGMNGTPGIVGQFVNLVWLHFTYNTVAYLPLLVVFFSDGYHRVVGEVLSSAARHGPGPTAAPP